MPADPSASWCLHPTGLSPYTVRGPFSRPISQPRRASLPRPFPARTSLQNPPMQMPGIRSNIQSHFLFPVSTCCCENARTRALRYLCTGAVYPYLYMKQLCTRLVCCAVSRLNHAARFPFIFTGKRASIHCTSVRLTLDNETSLN